MRPTECGFWKLWPVFSGNSGRLIVRELGAVNVEIEVLGAVRRAIEEHESTALENAVDDRLGQIGVVQHGAPGGQRRLVGREQHRAPAQVPLVDDMEQDVGRVRTVRQVAHLVDDQKDATGRSVHAANDAVSRYRPRRQRAEPRLKRGGRIVGIKGEPACGPAILTPAMTG